MASEVLEAFKRFDADGSGSISREELSEVLKSLDETLDEQVDNLLVLADASGDGELQVEEFVRWIFADDQQLAMSGVHDITLTISGCSFKKLNGDYVQQVGESHCQRPLYYCASNQQLLFYCSKWSQWSIFHKISGYSSARLKTKKSAHRGEGVTWDLYRKAKKGFVEEPEMTCTLRTSSETLSAPPAEFIQILDVEEFVGVFKKQEEMKDGRPVYYNSVCNVRIEYDQEKQKWALWPCNTDGVKKEKTTPIVSAETAGFSPDRATWRFLDHPIRFASIEPKAVTDQGGWKDPDFPHDISSIGEKMKDDQYITKGLGANFDEGCEWIRAINLTPDEEPLLFGEGPLVASGQGNVGDCGLIAAIACVSEFDGFVKNNIFMTKEISPDGKYTIRLFDYRDRKWKEIEIDDYLPCMVHRGLEGFEEGFLVTARPFFCDISPGDGIWGALLEKAFAKMHGAWANLHRFNPNLAFICFTGEFESCFYFVPSGKAAEQPTWRILKGGVKVAESSGRLAEGAQVQELERKRSWIRFKKIEGDGPDEGWFSYYVRGHRVATRTTKRQRHQDTDGRPEIEDFWATLLENDRANYMMIAGGVSKTNKNTQLYDNLTVTHAYSLLHCVEVEGVKLVQLRNPKGHAEWQGPWSDESSEWKQNPGISKALRVKVPNSKHRFPRATDDGCFWMEFEDFEWNFDFVNSCRVSMPSKHAGFQLGEME
mmetsp:Transcript_37673/g.90024  ORF Transcript_37673/g.90024 Transcript_37673/m.90024 type:complete len:711 (-) Transcript_37673:121-2253(-)|eukprot:CAMPEP_0181424276 /NCGR_PEP_ID=MMETSP1110-20121109/14560_1 /TAXON_ID=174948 /ORGANISM="Symbiodinium sp., Strain CCMP421" /LENGTH=710 /DNA_ID=CAMNT_0023547427 /DNA_START=80 /DNA_END=2212 /DNA_ORIENTATION=+